MERKLAHIQKITSITPIEGADSIEKATILGWEVVVKKGEFQENQLVVYCEVDSVLPDKPEFEFLRDRRFRIRTIKLRKQVSQGICFPISILSEGTYKEDQDVTELLGITKYLTPSEREENEREEARIKNEKNKLKKFMMRYSWFRKLFLSRKGKSGFPYWVTKTDEIRIQNLHWNEFYEQFKDKEVYITEKVDFQSGSWTGREVPRFSGLLGKLIPMTKYLFVVCSRNFVTNDKNSLHWQIAKKFNLEKVLSDNPTITIQGEQGDTKVQGNKYGIRESNMWVFNVIDHKDNYHYDYEEMDNFCYYNGLNHVPLIKVCKLSELGSTVQEIVEFSKGKSLINPNVIREGIVVRCVENGKKILSFKVINPDFLLKFSD